MHPMAGLSTTKMVVFPKSKSRNSAPEKQKMARKPGNVSPKWFSFGCPMKPQKKVPSLNSKRNNKTVFPWWPYETDCRKRKNTAKKQLQQQKGHNKTAKQKKQENKLQTTTNNIRTNSNNLGTKCKQQKNPTDKKNMQNTTRLCHLHLKTKKNIDPDAGSTDRPIDPSTAFRAPRRGPDPAVHVEGGRAHGGALPQRTDARCDTLFGSGSLFLCFFWSGRCF